jgi:DNA-binding CsgD family transcriptional regulator
VESTEALIAWHTLSEEPRLVCNRAGDLIWTNAAARDFAKHNLAEEPGNSDSLLIWRTALASGLFSRILATAVTCPAGKARSIVLDRVPDNGRVIIKVVPLAGDSEAPIGVTIPAPQKLSPERCADLQTTFGLSGAELRVLGYLVDGKTLFEAAEGLATSIFTARTHLRNIYQKLRVKNREAMFYLLSPLL